MNLEQKKSKPFTYIFKSLLTLVLLFPAISAMANDTAEIISDWENGEQKEIIGETVINSINEGYESFLPVNANCSEKTFITLSQLRSDVAEYITDRHAKGECAFVWKKFLYTISNISLRPLNDNEKKLIISVPFMHTSQSGTPFALGGKPYQNNNECYFHASPVMCTSGKAHEKTKDHKNTSIVARRFIEDTHNVNLDRLFAACAGVDLFRLVLYIWEAHPRERVFYISSCSLSPLKAQSPYSLIFSANNHFHISYNNLIIHNSRGVS